MPRVETYAREVIPVESFVADDLNDPSAPVQAPTVGVRWGAPSYFGYLQNPVNSDDDTPPDQQPSAHVVDTNEYKIFRGIQEVYRESVDTAPFMPRILLGDGPFAGHTVGSAFMVTRTSFFCGSFIERSEETEALGGGAISITPVVTIVRQFVDWQMPKLLQELEEEWPPSTERQPSFPDAVEGEKPEQDPRNAEPQGSGILDKPLNFDQQRDVDAEANRTRAYPIPLVPDVSIFPNDIPPLNTVEFISFIFRDD